MHASISELSKFVFVILKLIEEEKKAIRNNVNPIYHIEIHNDVFNFIFNFQYLSSNFFYIFSMIFQSHRTS